MLVSTLSAHLGLRSDLVDWYPDATSGRTLIYWLNCLSPCTNSESVPWKFYIRDRSKHLNFLDDAHTIFLFSPSVPIIFLRVRKSSRSVLSKKVYPLFLRMHSKSAHRKPAKYTKTSHGKGSRQKLVAFSKENNLEAKNGHFGVRKRFANKRSQ